uniref:Uncharacterized protein n=1 Tax=Cyclophora tenuis TaxID=216820 RepID=A0A6U1SKE9_CYCTE|mmetsp:Transcript_8468/g.14406  ORF Transcript_8468/g.14406 Transcript_8468/m.14406 type:complete len:145 (+) Transcript_8468:403-837(+)
MTTDFKNINATYAGDHGQLQQMQDQLNSAKKAISTDTEIIALGATGAIVSGLMIAVGVLAELGTAGASTTLVVAGISGEAASGTTIGLASADLVRQQKIGRDETTKIPQLTAEIALITTVSGQLSTLLEKGKAAETALLGLIKQ